MFWFKKRKPQKTTLNVPLLSLDRRTIIGETRLTYWEEDHDKYISIDKGPYFSKQIFTGWSLKVALDDLRESFESEGALIAVGGTLVYATYSRMCHDMGGGYAGYNYKNRAPTDMTIPARINTMDIIDNSEYSFVSTVSEQKNFSNNPEDWPIIIKKMSQ